MRFSLQGLIRLPTARLSRRIVLWVFVSVIFIEAIILIPSYSRRQQELLTQLWEISVARAEVLMRLLPPEATEEQLLSHVKHLSEQPSILGGSLYSFTGRNLGHFGERPQLTFDLYKKSNQNVLIDTANSRYDTACVAIQRSGEYCLILRHEPYPVGIIAEQCRVEYPQQPIVHFHGVLSDHTPIRISGGNVVEGHLVGAGYLKAMLDRGDTG